MSRFALFAAVFAALWFSPDADAAKVCEETLKGQTAICGLQRPEDMEFTPDENYLIISQMGDLMEGGPGNVAIMNRRDYSHAVAYPAAGADAPQDGWGDAACPGAPGARLSPHGIHLSRRGERWQLLVVNHGGRESMPGRDSMEFFELLPQQPAGWRLLWRGCVMGPEKAFFNDVVALPGAGFAVSHMMDKDAGGLWLTLKVFLGMDTGHVWKWTPAKGYSVIAGSEGGLVNGVQIDEDAEHLFINYYSENLVRKLRLADGEIIGEIHLAHPDNSNWTRGDNLLLIASHDTTMWRIFDCEGGADEPCLFPYQIAVVEPERMYRIGRLLRRKGPPMGGATVALLKDYDLYLGSFAGDRMVYMSVKKTQ